MSLTKRWMETARREVHHVQRMLDGIEYLSEVDFEILGVMSRSLAHAENLLTVTQSQPDQAYF